MQDKVKAKNPQAYALLLLRYRLRSEKELRQRLSKKGYSSQDIEKTISFLKKHNFVDDARFTHAWIQASLRKSLGKRRIIGELKRLGVDEELIQQELANLSNNYDESKMLLQLAKKRIKFLKNLDKDKLKRRLFTYLFRRGFEPELINETINRL